MRAVMCVGCGLALGSFYHQAIGAQDWPAATAQALLQLMLAFFVGLVLRWLMPTADETNTSSRR